MGAKETRMDQSTPHRAAARKDGLESLHGDPESMTLEELDEAFQRGAIEVTTLVRLQCIDDGAGCQSRPPRPLAGDDAVERPSSVLLGIAIDASDAWRTVRGGARGEGRPVAARSRRGRGLEAIAMGLLLAPAVGAFIVSEADVPRGRDLGAQLPIPERPRPSVPPGVVPSGETRARREIEATPPPPAKPVRERRKDRLALAVSNALRARPASVRRSLGHQ
jgi:hypothetical protein